MINTGLVAAMVCCLSLVANVGGGVRLSDRAQQAPPFIVQEKPWVDSVLNTMTVDEKIAQMFMVAAYSNKNKKEEDYINYLVKDKKIGGLIFMQGGPVRQANLINRYQASADIPLLIAMDAEWGPSMRLDSTVLYPRQMMLGAIQDNQLMYEIGEEYARQLKALGVHVNFAPLVDLNVNPKNPVINSRSYGELRDEVVRRAYYFSHGMQDNNVLAVIKHFPGHGDTDKDSHKTLPSIHHDRARLDSIELYPFRKLVNRGIGGVMVAHLFVPALDSAENRPSTLSENIVQNILKNDYGFNGLVFTDALNMKGVANFCEPGQLEVEAFLAGNDILLFPQNVPKAIESIKQAINSGKIKLTDVDRRVAKILAAKKWSGLFADTAKINPQGLYETLNNYQAHLVNRKIASAAITLAKDPQQILPIKNLDNTSIASVDLGSTSITTFQNRLKDYAQVPAYSYAKDSRNLGKDGLIDKLSTHDIIIVSVTKTNRRPSKNFGLSSEEIDFISKLAEKNKVVLAHFGNPYALAKFKSLKNIESVVVAYNAREITQDVAAQMIFGGDTFKGRLPVGISSELPAGAGITIDKQIRLGYTNIPEQVNINSELLYKVDSLVFEAINDKATPGAQVLAAKDGVVFFQKSYGHHTYNKHLPVKNDDIYDVASVTKIVASTASLMKLYEQGKWNLNDNLGQHLSFLQGTNKENLKFKDVLTHQARLAPWIPFYKNTIKENYNKYYFDQSGGQHSVCVADHMYTYNTMRDSILQQIADSDLRKRRGYRYSDLGFYLMREFIEIETQKPIQEYVESTFYKSLGAYTMGYNPNNRFAKEQIIPTERDDIFRKQLLCGYVHDQGAAMLGGVSGHAGIFSNANDLAKMMQMFLNKGEYGGVRYFNAETVNLFTSPLRNPEDNRRGIGFDKPVLGKPGKGPACDSVSPESFGHSGFTGILAWVDPETQILYIFMSNRVYPDMENKKILKLNTRTNVQEVFYQAIMK